MPLSHLSLLPPPCLTSVYKYQANFTFKILDLQPQMSLYTAGFYWNTIIYTGVGGQSMLPRLFNTKFTHVISPFLV